MGTGIRFGWVLAAVLGAAGGSLARGAAAPAPWERLQAALQRSARIRLAAGGLLTPCGERCEERFNQRLVLCYAMPSSALRTECISQALADLEACDRACSGR